MGKTQLKGLTTNDNGEIFADDDSPIGMAAAEMANRNRGGGANVLQIGASAFQAITGLIDQDTALVYQRQLEDSYDYAEDQRRAFAVKVEEIADGPVKDSLRLLNQVDIAQDDSIETSSRLAALQRRQSINSGITGAANFAGQVTGGGGGGGGGYGGGGLGGAALPLAAGAVGYLAGRDGRDDDRRGRYYRRGRY